jgi:hypothetical protein
MGCIGALFRVPFGAILGYLVIAALIIAGLAAVVAFAGVAFCFEGDSWVGSERFLLATLGVSAAWRSFSSACSSACSVH